MVFFKGPNSKQNNLTTSTQMHGMLSLFFSIFILFQKMIRKKVVYLKLPFKIFKEITSPSINLFGYYRAHV